MNPAAPLYPPKATPGSGDGDISAPQPTPQAVQTSPDVSTPTTTSTTSTSTASAPAAPASSARPVMSAKAAINAMYASDKTTPSAKLIPSAREAVNAASRLTPKNFKSASNLHHGSLQKIQKVAPAPQSLESTRTSASALLKTTKTGAKHVPVVRTSLKLGANARPKDGPVVLPAGARMASAARPVANLSDSGNDSITVKRSVSGGATRIVLSGQPKLPASRPRRLVRDPQMLNGGRRTLSVKSPSALPASTMSAGRSINDISSTSNTLAGAASRQRVPDQPIIVLPNQSNAPLSPTVTAINVTSSTKKSIRPRRFRTAPKNYAEAEPSVSSVDSSYVMSEPPKLAARRRSDTKPEDLGVVKSFRPSKLPEPIGDAAPIGRLAVQRVASGHGGPAHSEPSIKAENTSNYSFSRREDKSTKPAPYAPADKSPFLKSVNVEKRPLSDNSVPAPISLPRTAEPKPEKASRKNNYQKRAEAKSELPTRPTVIVPSSRRSKAPLFFLIIFTIILGAAVGAAVYLCFFQ